MPKSIQALFLLLSTQFFWGQNTKILTGKITNADHSVEKVNVLNETTGQVTFSDIQGVFSILVKIDDVLVLSAVNLETKRIVIDASNWAKKTFLVKMSTAITPLEEVKVNDNQGITAENLGIIPHGQKKYTPAERRLREATTGGAGIVPLNPILNAISGRTKMLKKELRVEKKERLLVQLDGWFDDAFYENTLKIQTDYIKGFHYYLIDDFDFVRALKAKNKTLTQFLAKGLALKYHDILSVEQK